jgi:hypothetical protein
MSEREKATLVKFLEFLKNKNLRPIDIRKVNFSNINPEFFEDDAIALPAMYLLDLTDEELITLSKIIRKKVGDKMSQLRKNLPREDLDLFKDDKFNGVIHEVNHLRKIMEFRPEVVSGSILGILLLENDEGIINFTMVLMTPQPELPYTPLEKVIYLLEPAAPSNQDYDEIIRYLRTHQPSTEDIRQIVNIARAKPKTVGRSDLADFLRLMEEN